jgi:hypothetical protein
VLWSGSTWHTEVSSWDLLVKILATATGGFLAAASGGLEGKNNISIKTTLLLIKRLLFHFTRN